MSNLFAGTRPSTARRFKVARLSAAIGMCLMLSSTPLIAQTVPDSANDSVAKDKDGRPKKTAAADGKTTESLEAITVTGIRASVEKAQDTKRYADTFVDSVSATDIGALPDRSVTETLSRIPGVTIDHFLSVGDPEHFSAEGNGVQVRGLTQVRSELNGRDSFSANGGRALSFEDVPRN